MKMNRFKREEQEIKRKQWKQTN